MIRPFVLLHILGHFLLALAGFMVISLGFTLRLGGDPRLFGYTAAITAVAGLVLSLVFPRPTRELTQREGLLLVCLIWLVIGIFGALPFYFSPHFGSCGRFMIAEIIAITGRMSIWLFHWMAATVS